MTDAAAATYTDWMNRVVLLVLACALFGGCGSDRDATPTNRSEPPAAAASCIFAIEYRGHHYVGSAVASAPPKGARLGEATQPACNDTPGAVEDPADQLVDVVEIEGVRPEIAIALPGRDDVVLVRDDVDPAHLPPALARLMR